MSLWSPGPVLIAGPCVIEDHSTNVGIATRLLEISEKCGVRVVFKASFDKANRSNADALRGPGFEPGLELLERVVMRFLHHIQHMWARMFGGDFEMTADEFFG